MAQVDIDVRLKAKEEEEEDTFRGKIAVSVSGESGQTFSDATIRVVSKETDYEESKTSSEYGISQKFENVPMPATVIVEKTGFQKKRSK